MSQIQIKQAPTIKGVLSQKQVRGRFDEVLGTKSQTFLATIVQLATYNDDLAKSCLLYTSPSPRDRTRSRMPSSA